MTKHLSETDKDYVLYNILWSHVISRYVITQAEVLSQDREITSVECELGTLKGQCHKMVVEVRPWSGRLGLN
jgi:predicted transcriptional regulator